MAKKMTNLTEDDDVIPSDARVKFHYNAYLDYADEPFNSSYMRNYPFSFNLSRYYIVMWFSLFELFTDLNIAGHAASCLSLLHRSHV